MILAAGLSPAWQQILVFERLLTGEVNRACSADRCASGKVLNVARACHSLGADTMAISTAGGLPGEALRAEFARDGIPARWIATAAPTRTCTTLIDRESGSVTELVENAGPVSEDEVADFVAVYRDLARTTAVVVLTGSLPPGAPPDLYSRLLQTQQLPAILDVRGPELLAAVRHRPLLVKPNRSELELTLGRELRSEADLQAAMRELNRQGAEWVLVTQGTEAAWLSSATRVLCFTPKVSHATVNPIGCGDCVAAGIAVRVSEGASIPDAVAFGMAAAAENAGALLPARVFRPAVERGLARP